MHKNINTYIHTQQTDRLTGRETDMHRKIDTHTLEGGGEGGGGLTIFQNGGGDPRRGGR